MFIGNKNAAQRLSAPSRVRSGAGLQLQALEMRTPLDRTGTVLLCDSTLAVLLTVVVVIAARFM
jgi:hypothetical protein